jgi:orotate phosphoribosyltransferase
MQAYKKDFLDLATKYEALKFGSFTLKSGRTSPYFFNLGLFNTGVALSTVGASFAQVIINSGVEFDVIFGPAYKGIPLAAVTAAKIAELGGEKYATKEYAFNRKEAKDHGEGGNIVGASLKGKKVLIIDDVITAGTAIKEAFSIIDANGATVSAVVIALDRQETTVDSPKSAVQVVSQTYNVPVLNIFNLNDVIQYTDGILTEDEKKKIEQYRDQYSLKE